MFDAEAAMGVDVNAQLDPDSSYIQSIARYIKRNALET